MPNKLLPILMTMAVAASFALAGPATQPVTNKTFVRTKLAELDKFKNTPEFLAKGFGGGGPYNGWLKAVEAKKIEVQADKTLPLNEKLGVAYLQQLGLAYVFSKGEETKETVWLRKEIASAIEDKKQ